MGALLREQWFLRRHGLEEERVLLSDEWKTFGGHLSMPEFLVGSHAERKAVRQELLLRLQQTKVWVMRRLNCPVNPILNQAACCHVSSKIRNKSYV